MRVKLSVSPAALLLWAGAALVMPPGRLLSLAAAIAAHEAAHLCAMAAFGIPVRELRIRAAGLEIEHGTGVSSYSHDAAVSLAGPAASLALGALCIFAGGAARGFGLPSAILGGFNALPIRGLDGGNALGSLLAGRLPPDRAERISRAVSFAVTLILWAFSVYILLTTGGNFTPFAVSCVLFASQAFG